jgi:hypothetical protein
VSLTKLGCAVVLIATAGQLASASSPDLLVGTFAVQKDGALKDFVRIDRRAGRYFISEMKAGGWSAGKEVMAVSKQAFEKIVKKPVTVEFVGLGHNQAALFNVPRGWTSGTFVCRTGYWLATLLGPIEVHKR